MVSLTFDAAWGDEDTGQLIDILGKHNVRVTFFATGDWVDRCPESVKALHDAGHEIMNHSDTHPHMPDLTREKMLRELRTCNDKIQAITGYAPPCTGHPTAIMTTRSSRRWNRPACSAYSGMWIRSTGGSCR